MLIAFIDGKRIGALLSDYSNQSKRYHRSQWRLYGDHFNWVRDRSIKIIRIYSKPKKWKVHEALLETIIRLAPILIEEQIAMVEAVSYDFHPLAQYFGFNIEIPFQMEGSFYYWKPFFLPASLRHRTTASRFRLERVKSILNARRNCSYYMVAAQSRNMHLAIRKKAWAIRYLFAGQWRSLSKGDVVFFKTEDECIVAYGIVSNTEKRGVKGLEKFPLWIDFDDGIVGGFSIDLSKYLFDLWYINLKQGALSALPNEFGSNLILISKEKLKEGKMWVEPNPYLLRGTSFEVISKRIFIVQAWDLREKVLPLIKEILGKEGYSSVYAGDRDGQVIFEDIWIMLNESEAVIVDFTYKRPNVYLEYGMALVLGKPVIAITQEPADIPSDTPNLKYILYENTLGDLTLQDQLPVAIRDTIIDIERAKKT